MSCIAEEKPFYIYEWSDTHLEFVLTEKTNWEETPLDLTEYDSVVLVIKYSDDYISEITWIIDSEDISDVVFEILSEATTWKSWKFYCEIWWLHWEDKVRLSETFEWEILHSIKIPEWIIQE